MQRTEPVDPDVTRTQMTWIVMPSQANALGTVFGGQVMAWVDVCAAVAAQRFARCDVVTASMDQLTFEAPMRQGDVVVVEGMVNWAGRTSMEVGVRVLREDPYTGRHVPTTTASLTFVTVDRHGKPVPVPPILLVSDEHRRRFAEAELRRAGRLRAKDELAAQRARETA